MLDDCQDYASEVSATPQDSVSETLTEPGTFVYKYHLTAPIENAQYVRDQMWRSCLHYNAYTRINRDAREDMRLLLSQQPGIQELSKEYADAAQVVSDLYSDIKKSRARIRAVGAVSEQEAALVPAKAREKEALAALRKKQKEVLDPDATRCSCPLVPAKNKRGEVRKDKKGKVKMKRAPQAGSDCIHAKIAAIYARSKEKKNATNRGKGELYWGTSQLADMATDAASAKVLTDFGYAEGKEPKFWRFDGTGAVGVQIQIAAAKEGYKGKPPMYVSDLFKGDPRVSISLDKSLKTPVKPARNARIAAARARNAARHEEAVARGGGSKNEFGVLRMLVGKHQRKPVYASWGILMHRPPPLDYEVKRASVHAVKSGPGTEHYLILTIKAPPRAATVATGTVAVEFGWHVTQRERFVGGKRIAEDVLRVAMWMDPTGESGELILGADVVGRFRKANDLASIRDNSFNAAKENLVGWLKDHEMPEWMLNRTVRKDTPTPTKKQALSYLSEWESNGRMHSFARYWAKNRFPGDSEGDVAYAEWLDTCRKNRENGSKHRPQLPEGLKGFAALEAWRYHDLHLWCWQDGQRSKVIGYRKDMYNVTAKRLTEKYGLVIAQDIDLRDIIEHDKIKLRNKHADSNRQMAAPAQFRTTLQQAFRSRGGVYKMTPKEAPISITCPECGTVDSSHQDKQTHSFACSKCSFEEDVDKTALLNLLRAAGHDKEVDLLIPRMKLAKGSLKFGT